MESCKQSSHILPREPGASHPIGTINTASHNPADTVCSQGQPPHGLVRCVVSSLLGCKLMWLINFCSSCLSSIWLFLWPRGTNPCLTDGWIGGGKTQASGIFPLNIPHIRTFLSIHTSLSLHGFPPRPIAPAWCPQLHRTQRLKPNVSTLFLCLNPSEVFLQLSGQKLSDLVGLP